MVGLREPRKATVSETEWMRKEMAEMRHKNCFMKNLVGYFRDFVCHRKDCQYFSVISADEYYLNLVAIDMDQNAFFLKYLF